MASTKTHFPKNPREGDDHLKLKLLENLGKVNVYRDVKSEIYENLVRLGVTPSSIHLPIVKEFTSASPMTRSELYTIKLYNTDNNILTPLITLFLQVYHSGMGGNLSDIDQPVSDQQADSPIDKLREVEYRRRHMKFWNEIELPAPQVVDVKKLTGKDYDLPEETGFAVGLITNYLPGVTHDLDMLALNMRLRQIDEHLRDRLTPDYLKETLTKEKGILTEARSTILGSIFDTQNQFAVVGTHNMCLPRNKELLGLTIGDRLRTQTSKNPLQSFRLSKSADYFKNAYRWHCRIKENRNANPSEMTRKFKNSILPILKPSIEEDKFVYMQGDEFLHHYQYVPISIDGKMELISYVFDADHSCLDRIERARAKTLLSSYLNLNYDQVCEYVRRSTTKLEDLLKNFTKVEFDVVRSRMSYLENMERVLYDFDLIALDEAICMIGRAAKDDLRNVLSTKKREDKFLPYSETYLLDVLRGKLGMDYDRLPGAVTLESLKPRYNIKVLKDRVGERVTRILDGKTQYGKPNDDILKSLGTLYDMIRDFDFDVENGSS